MNEETEIVWHLLIKGENKVWCIPRRDMGSFKDINVTIYPSKCSCVNCLTRYRKATSSKQTVFRKKWTSRYNP